MADLLRACWDSWRISSRAWIGGGSLEGLDVDLLRACGAGGGSLAGFAGVVADLLRTCWDWWRISCVLVVVGGGSLAGLLPLVADLLRACCGLWRISCGLAAWRISSVALEQNSGLKPKRARERERALHRQRQLQRDGRNIDVRTCICTYVCWPGPWFRDLLRAC